MDKFSVNQLAKLANVSVRTLHHYDRIGLLKPGARSESKYRYYGEAELLRLQQILFYKEMELSLAQISDILDDPDFDTLKALQVHKKEMQKRKARTAELLKTIDKTINYLANRDPDSPAKKNKTMKFEDMYKGFSKEQAEAYEKEAKERWGESIVEESKQRVRNMGKEGLEILKQEGENISKELSELMHLPVEDGKVQALVKRHYNMINQYYTVTTEIYRGLGDMYVADDRFRVNYDKYKEGLAEFLRDAMHIYCERIN